MKKREASGWETVTGKWAIEEVAGASQNGKALVQRATKNAFNVIVAPGGPYFKWPWQRVHKVTIATQTNNLAWDPEDKRANQDASGLLDRLLLRLIATFQETVPA
jgi:hypothetical protein